MSIEERSKQYGQLFGDWHIGQRLDDGSNSRSAVFVLCRDSNDWQELSALKIVTLVEEHGKQENLLPYCKVEYSTVVKEQRDRAEQEVRLMEQLRGKTNIVDYLDHSFYSWRDQNGFGVDLLIRMELLKNLRSEMRSGRQFDNNEILKIGQDICTALVLCHRKNIIHRDIKPENIFFNSDGDYKLGDFGISRIMDDSPSVVVSTSVGTPAYAAPEQSRGSYDKRADIYSLGLVLYELCNGNRLPFARSSFFGEKEIQLRLSGTPLPPPGQKLSEDPFETISTANVTNLYATQKAAYSEQLIRVIMKACAFRPEDRYATAQEMLDELMGSPPADTSTPPAHDNDPAAPPKRAKGIPGWLIICTIGVLVAVIGFLFYSRFFAPPDSGSADDEKQESETITQTMEPNPTATPTPVPTATPTPVPTATPTPEPTPTPHVRQTSGDSTAGTTLRDIVYDNSGRIVSLTEIVNGNWLKWTYVYDRNGDFLYRTRNIGNVDANYVWRFIPGSGGSQSVELTTPVENCVGFTLYFKVTKVTKGSALGERRMYISDGKNWETVGTFSYNSLVEKTVTFTLDYPRTIVEYGTGRVNPDDSAFEIIQLLRDVIVADYDYVELKP